MEIFLDQEAKDSIMGEIDKSITIRVVDAARGLWSNGCGDGNRQPSVGRGTPANTQVYEKMYIEGICVYYSQELETLFKSITIKMEKLFFIKILVGIGKR